MSLSNKKNKREICKLHFVNKSKINIVAGCADGAIIFFLKPHLQRNKEVQSSNDLEQCLIKNGIHNQAIMCIKSTNEFIAIGSLDNKVSIWKIIGISLNTVISFPSARIQSGL
jgi:WD40 repeat protein